MPSLPLPPRVSDHLARIVAFLRAGQYTGWISSVAMSFPTKSRDLNLQIVPNRLNLYVVMLR